MSLTVEEDGRSSAASPCLHAARHLGKSQPDPCSRVHADGSLAGGALFERQFKDDEDRKTSAASDLSGTEIEGHLDSDRSLHSSRPSPSDAVSQPA